MARSPAKKKTSNLTPFYLIIGVVAILGIGILAYQTMAAGSPATEPVAVDIDPAELARVPGIAIGREDAPVVMYEFADFQCPGCAGFASLVAPLIKERLVDRGLVRYVYYDFPLVSIHPHAFLASRAGRCANEQDRFWDYHDVLYARQSRWSAMRDVTGYFVDIAAELGLNRSQFDSCLRSDQYAEEVTRNLRLGESLGVQGTPTLFVNGRRLASIPSYSDLEAMVMQEAGQAPAGEQQAPAADTTMPAAQPAPGA
ncbi:thioredoxin domain-containing protein [soil metagenome]